MGEIVAEKWSEEEELLFHKVVFSNPASLGRNFWVSLASVFPYRTKEDIVSYYFNVFMLCKRSQQNRYESMSINSYNDEWQKTDDSWNNEAGCLDEDGDSIVESPMLTTFQKHILGICNFGSDTVAQVHEKTLKVAQGEEEEQEEQDDSCTTSNVEAESQEKLVNPDNTNEGQGNFNRLNNGGSHGYALEPCDTKVWDAGYPTCQKNRIDLLPTCSMIEEVFGDGS
ncbi:hypothetical protein DITRI_Ditri03aG0105100 [Diplodiscus trichospermus]